MDDVPTSLVNGRISDVHYILSKLVKDEKTDATATELAHTAIEPRDPGVPAQCQCRGLLIQPRFRYSYNRKLLDLLDQRIELT